MGLDLSIAINLYDYTNYKQLDAVLCSIRKQTLPTEIILSEQFYQIEPNNKVVALAKKYKCKYILSRTEKNSKGLVFSLGKMRNIAASVCDTPYIYFSDADVIFLEPQYFENIIKFMRENKNIALFHPLMFRLKKDDTEKMVTAILSDETIPIHATNCFVRYNRSEGIINDSKIQTEYDSDYYKAWLNNFTDNTINEKHIKAYKNNYINIHGGGTIVHIDDFWKIGGYGESFFQWGCEDEDFHKKLSGVCICYKLGTIINQYNVLHLEHDLNWNNKMYLINNKLANNRKKLNVSDIVKIDLSMPNSFANAYINKNDSFLKKCILKAENFSEK